MSLSGQTRLAAVIGWPVRHSRSPAIHNAAFAARDLDWIYLALPVEPGQVAPAVAGMRALGIEGLSVTMPHKTSIMAALDRCSADAIALRAVNCVRRDGDRLIGENTDGGGFIDALRLDEDLDPSGMRCTVVGAGGAARAVVRSLAGAGAARVAVINRSPAPAAHAAALAGDVGAVGGPADLAEADLLVQATPVGMGDDTGLAFDVDAVRGDAVIVDLVYHPLETPLLAAARSRGQRTVGGLGMLVHQAARAFEAWTSIEAPRDAMWAAAKGEIRRNAADDA